MLPEQLLGQCLFPTVLTGLDEFEAFLSLHPLNTVPLYWKTHTLGNHMFDIWLHQAPGQQMVMEWEAVSDPGLDSDLTAFLKPLMVGSLALKPYSNLVVRQIQQLTGYDRVMVYQFDDEWNGEVIAEALARPDETDSFLSLHYPASDIPSQARELYRSNLLRLIPTIDYTPVALKPLINPATQAPLDMSHCILRSVSPIHLEYLKNMGVQATLTISILLNKRLWGLIACHHHKPMYLSRQKRTLCELVAQLMPIHLMDLRERQNNRVQLQLTGLMERLADTVRMERSFLMGLTNQTPNMLNLIDASGAAVFYRNEVFTIGKTPPKSVIQQLANWLDASMDGDIFATRELSRHNHLGQEVANMPSGLLAVSMERHRNCMLMWFREEMTQSVLWGGNPEKPAEMGEHGQLTPRKSFEAWQQTVRGRSKPWRTWEIAVAQRLRDELLSTVLDKMDTLTRLNEELAKANRLSELTVQKKSQYIANLSQANEALSKDKLMAEEAVHKKNQFIANMSHELRTPLNAIIGYSEMLDAGFVGDLNEKQQRYVHNVVVSGHHLLGLINQVLDLAKIEAGKALLNTEWVSVNQLVTDLHEMTEAAARQRGVTLQFEVSPGFEGFIADGLKVRQIFLNLISNAIKFNHPEGTVTVRLSVDPNSQEVVGEVEDTGIGIPPDKVHLVFSEFFQVDASYTRQEEGSGLGLYLTRKLIELHGGHISVESVLGEGSRFRFVIPWLS